MNAVKTLSAIRENMKKAVVGKDGVIDQLLIALICSGHVLVEDLPGLGKTTLVSALAASLGCEFQRIQFTPDVLPSDITGYSIIQMQTGEEIFRPGSIHHQIVLADEINRASPKTQSALLEAMQERQVTVDGKTYPLPQPFMVLATQNPVEMAGTYPLPEAQMDRFLMRVSLGYPSHAEELDIVRSRRSVTTPVRLSPVAAAKDILAIQAMVENIHMEDGVLEYIVALAEYTRTADNVLIGVSPRGTIALAQAACAAAILQGREYVLPDDVKKLAPGVLAHRIVMKNRSGGDGHSAMDVVKDALRTVRAPRIK